MIINFKISSSSKFNEVPATFRRNILSMIKEALLDPQTGGDRFSHFWEHDNKRIKKPITFSTFFEKPYNCTKTNKVTFESNGFFVNISTHDVHIGNTICAWILGHKSWKLFSDIPTWIVDVKVNQHKIIGKDQALFHIASPVVVNAVNKKKKRYYVTDDSDIIKEVMYNNITMLCQDFIDPVYSIDKKDFDFSFTSKHRVISIPHYEHPVISHIGDVIVKAPAEALNLIHQIGVGSKRTHGFGMLHYAG